MKRCATGTTLRLTSPQVVMGRKRGSGAADASNLQCTIRHKNHIRRIKQLDAAITATRLVRPSRLEERAREHRFCIRAGTISQLID